MPGAVDAAANLVDIAGSPADGCGQLFLLGVIHLDDVTVNRHLAEICAHVPGAELRHLVLDERRSCSVTQNSMRIGLVRSAIGYSPPQTTTDNFLRIGGDTRKNIPFHISTDSFGQKLGTCSEKISLSLYNGHFIRRLAGMTGKKF